MFEIGDYIVCGNNGICTVENIGTIDVPDINPDRQYYILQPVYAKGSVVYIPIDNEKIVMRKILTRDEVNALIDQIPQIDTIEELNDKLREEQFKECLKHHDCTDWIRIIKTLYLRRQAREKRGQKVTATDARYLKVAEDNLYCEFAMALGIDRSEVVEFIEQRIGAEQKTDSGMDI